MDALQSLRDTVAAAATVEDSAIELIKGFQQRLDDAVKSAREGDPAALQTLVDTIGAETTRLAAAVTENTPAAALPIQ